MIGSTSIVVPYEQSLWCLSPDHSDLCLSEDQLAQSACGFAGRSTSQTGDSHIIIHIAAATRSDVCAGSRILYGIVKRLLKFQYCF